MKVELLANQVLKLMVGKSHLGDMLMFFNLVLLFSLHFSFNVNCHCSTITSQLMLLLKPFTYNSFSRYTFCGLAAMILINEANRLDLPRLIVSCFFCFRKVLGRDEYC